MTLNTVEKNAQTVRHFFSHTYTSVTKQHTKNQALGFNISRCYRQYTRGFSSVMGIYQLELAERMYSLLDAWTAPMCACTRRPCVHCMPIGTQSFVPLTHQPFASKTFSSVVLYNVRRMAISISSTTRSKNANWCAPPV